MSLQQHPETRCCHVTVAAQQGIVMLSGVVSSRLEREQIVSIAWATPGVTLVKGRPGDHTLTRHLSFKDHKMNYAPLASPQERRLIHLKDAAERRGWIESLQCSEAKLVEVMAVVGNSPEAVRLYLMQHTQHG